MRTYNKIRELSGGIVLLSLSAVWVYSALGYVDSLFA